MTGEELYAKWAECMREEGVGTPVPWAFVSDTEPHEARAWDALAKRLFDAAVAELDSLIEHWRVLAREAGERIEDKKLSHSELKDASRNRLVARCYVDAYQSVRVNMTGEKLPEGS